MCETWNAQLSVSLLLAKRIILKDLETRGKLMSEDKMLCEKRYTHSAFTDSGDGGGPQSKQSQKETLLILEKAKLTLRTCKKLQVET